MHLFAGIGGGLLADLILGHRSIVAVEWDKYACKILRERASEGWFPDLRVWEGDVRLFDPSEYAGKVDCIHAGFPCQDISVAGKQAGVGAETRSGLYREVLRIACVVRPCYLFLENVAAIVSNGLETVISDITALGYDAEWICLRASDCGANHHRDRWWLLAHARYKGVCEQGQLANAVEDVRESRGICCDGLSISCRKEGDVLADAERIGLSGPGQPVNAKHSTTAKDWEAIEPVHGCFGDFWRIEPGLGQLVDGVPNRVCQSGEEINANSAKNSARQDLQNVREVIQSESDAKRTQSGCEAISEAGVLQSVMCEHTRNYDIDCARVLVHGEEAPEELLRGLRLHEGTSRAPHRPRQDEQRTGEHSDALQALPQLLAHGSKANEQGNSWSDAFVGYWEVEPDIGRVATGISNRAGQLKGYGNAQVPLQAATAWKLLGGP